MAAGGGNTLRKPLANASTSLAKSSSQPNIQHVPTKKLMEKLPPIEEIKLQIPGVLQNYDLGKKNKKVPIITKPSHLASSVGRIREVPSFLKFQISEQKREFDSFQSDVHL